MYNKQNTFNNTNYNNQSDSKLYDPYNGLIRGNLFKNLYDPYKSKEPYEIKPMNEQARMLTDIDALGFAMIDLNLYLDVYPNDREKINLYNEIKVFWNFLRLAIARHKQLCYDNTAVCGSISSEDENIELILIFL